MDFTNGLAIRMNKPDVILEEPLPGVPGAFVREVPSLPEHLAGGRTIGPYTEVAPGALLFGVPGLGRFLIRDGTMIDIWIVPGADRSAVKYILLGSALGTLVHQRGELALQAVTMISPSGAGIAICGSSAIGKSTLAAALSRRRWLLLGDGITRISASSSAGIAWPGEARLQLWRDACEALDVNIEELDAVRENFQKYFVPVPAVTAPAPLEFAVRLQAGATCALIELSPTQRPELFFQSAFRPRQIAPLGQREAHARSVHLVSRSCRAIVLNGARQNAVSELADVLSGAVT